MARERTRREAEVDQMINLDLYSSTKHCAGRMTKSERGYEDKDEDPDSFIQVCVAPASQSISAGRMGRWVNLQLQKSSILSTGLYLISLVP